MKNISLIFTLILLLSIVLCVHSERIKFEYPNKTEFQNHYMILNPKFHPNIDCEPPDPNLIYYLNLHKYNEEAYIAKRLSVHPQLYDIHKPCLCPAAYNPEEPDILFHHHPSICDLLKYGYVGMFHPDMVREINGVATLYDYDCDNWRYGVFHKSRVYPCKVHNAMVNAHFNGTIAGSMPIIDEEYFEWIDNTLGAIEAINRMKLKGDNASPAVFAEYGARYGTWIVRAAQTFRSFGGGEKFILHGVEGDPISFKWMLEHFKIHNIKYTQTRPDNVCLTENDGINMRIKWEGETETLCKGRSFDSLVAAFDIIDLLHVDVQHGEIHMLTDARVDLATKKIRRIHFGVHSPQLHANIKKMFGEHNGWRLTADYIGSHSPTGPLTQTPYGKVIFNDGVIGMVNTNLDHLYIKT